MQTLIQFITNPELEVKVQAALERLTPVGGHLGALNALCSKLALIQNSVAPTFHQPSLVVFAADHGMAVEGLPLVDGLSTHAHALRMLTGDSAARAMARAVGLSFRLVDCGIAEPLPKHPRLLSRKIAHGTRNVCLGAAMSLDQTQAALRVGMEVSDRLRGNVLACAGLGQGAYESAALILSRLSQLPVRNFLVSGPNMPQELLTQTLPSLHNALNRHRAAILPIDVLATLGGFEIAVMAGAMMVAASKRHLILADGLPAYAALLVASRIAPAVLDYALLCRSHTHRGLEEAQELLQCPAIPNPGLECTLDGAGAAAAWPTIQVCMGLLGQVNLERNDSNDSGAQDSGFVNSAPLGVTSRSAAEH
ncbi:nicotinate-nucleotide--dimethylbenzimidazole phosphoribosyltransferase [Roseateles sp. BYS180W]|uniref:Nicotinate-nucleotide--dimethylbenzimidazole phosphoribosyltransferase n=1 Tax=Roseateles rivi TaxID=3299028 RepID=A0ABW7FRA6_9BURK